MRDRLASLLICVLGVGLAAQSPANPAQPQPSLPDGSTVTVTGCLREGETVGSFVLTGVTPTPTAATAQSPGHHDATPKRDEPGTPAPSTARREPETLRLAGATTRLKLNTHVGHTVSATGMIAPADPIVRPAVVLPDMPPGDTTSRKAGADGGWSSARVLHVRSVTRVTNGCQ